MTEKTNETISDVLTDMRGKLKEQFDKMLEDPVNFNNLYEHVSLLTASVDTLIQVIIPMYQPDAEIESEDQQD